MTFLITAVAIIAGLTFVALANSWWAGRVRLSWLRDEYPDPDLRQRIYKREIWAGMTRQQLIHSQNDPREIETATGEDGRPAEIFKYDKLGDRYRLRIRLVDGVVKDWVREK